jgi:hypothetical protein
MGVFPISNFQMTFKQGSSFVHSVLLLLIMFFLTILNLNILLSSKFTQFVANFNLKRVIGRQSFSYLAAVLTDFIAHPEDCGAVQFSAVQCSALQCSAVYSVFNYYTVLSLMMPLWSFLRVLAPQALMRYLAHVHCTALHCTALHCTALHFLRPVHYRAYTTHPNSLL